MLTLGILVVLTVVFALLRGGSLQSLANTKFRMAVLLFLGLGIQLAAEIVAPPWLEGGAGLAVIIGTNVIVAAFLFLNRSYAGTGLAALGLMLNVLVISANGAMPVNARAARDAGVTKSLEDVGLKHELMGPDTLLPWLGDTIGFPNLGELLSVGDVVLALGIARLVYSRMTIEKSRGRHSASAPPRR